MFCICHVKPECSHKHIVGATSSYFHSASWVAKVAVAIVRSSSVIFNSSTPCWLLSRQRALQTCKIQTKIINMHSWCNLLNGHVQSDLSLSSAALLASSNFEEVSVRRPPDCSKSSSRRRIRRVMAATSASAYGTEKKPMWWICYSCSKPKHMLVPINMI